MVVDINGSICSSIKLQLREPARGYFKAKLSSRMRVKRPLSRLAALEPEYTSPPHTDPLRDSSRKAGDFISTMEFATTSACRISYLLQRMCELSISASNGLLSERAREELDKDFNSLHEEIERIVGSTKFEDINFLDGSFNSITIEGGFGAKTLEECIEVKLSDFSIPKTLSSGIASKAAAMNTIESVKAALSDIDEKSESFSLAAGRARVALGNLRAAGFELSSTRSGAGLLGETQRSFIPAITMRLLAPKG